MQATSQLELPASHAYSLRILGQRWPRIQNDQSDWLIDDRRSHSERLHIAIRTDFSRQPGIQRQPGTELPYSALSTCSVLEERCMGEGHSPGCLPCRLWVPGLPSLSISPRDTPVIRYSYQWSRMHVESAADGESATTGNLCWLASSNCTLSIIWDCQFFVTCASISAHW